MPLLSPLKHYDCCWFNLADFFTSYAVFCGEYPQHCSMHKLFILVVILWAIHETTAVQMFYAILAGTCAAVAAASVKLAFGSSSCKVFTLFGLIGYVFCNVLMWWAHVHSLRESSSTFKAIAVNTGVNFFITSLFGALCFGEVHSVQWWFGTVILAAGTVLIISSRESKEKSD